MCTPFLAQAERSVRELTEKEVRGGGERELLRETIADAQLAEPAANWSSAEDRRTGARSRRSSSAASAGLPSGTGAGGLQQLARRNENPLCWRRDHTQFGTWPKSYGGVDDLGGRGCSK